MCDSEYIAFTKKTSLYTIEYHSNNALNFRNMIHNKLYTAFIEYHKSITPEQTITPQHKLFFI